MNLFQELRERRVFQFTSAYVVGGFGLIQFLEFLEGRMALSPHLVNLVGLALLLLLPSVILLAWSLGRPGRDTLGRTGRLAVPANVLVTAVLLFVLFGGKELGAVTRTVEIHDEHGAVVEREVPKSEFRRRLWITYLDDAGGPEDDWLREGVPLLLASDVSQDIFLDVALPLNMGNAMRDVDHPDGRDLPRPLLRRIAGDAHYDHYTTGSVARTDAGWRLVLELHDTDHGRIVSTRTHEGADLFALVDEATRALRIDLGLPEAHIEASPDLPVAEVVSPDLDAVRGHTAGLLAMVHDNDWAGAVAPLEDAVSRDPGYALAQFLLFSVYQTVGREADSVAAMSAAMDNLFRVTERTRFLIKAQYYFNIEKDMDKAIAVMEMWTRLFPSDVEALSQMALFHFIRQDLEAALADYQTILEIDPSEYRYLEDIADLQRRLGRNDEAEATLQSYVDRFPGRAAGYNDLADFYSEIGRLDDAREALEAARLLEPNALDLTLGVIDLDVKLGRYAESETALADLLVRAESARERAKVHARRLQLAQLRGRGDALVEGIDGFYAAMSEVQNPLQLDIVYSLLVPALCHVGRAEDAIVRLAAAAERIPEPFDDLTCVGRAWALADLGRPDEARAELASATAVVDQYQFETFRPTLALVEGIIDEAADDGDAAVAAYRKALEFMVQVDPTYHAHLAGALRRTGERREARDVLETGLTLHPAHPEINLEMAWLCFEDGRLEPAREYLAVARSAWEGADPGCARAAEAVELARRLESTP